MASHDEDAPEIGDKIREIREMQGLSISTLAKRAGLDNSYLSRLERGLYTSPKEDTLFKIAGALRLTRSQWVELAKAAGHSNAALAPVHFDERYFYRRLKKFDEQLGEIIDGATFVRSQLQRAMDEVNDLAKERQEALKQQGLERSGWQPLEDEWQAH